MSRDSQKPGEEVVEGAILEWEAPDRPFKKRDKTWFTTAAVVVVLVSFVALLLQEFLLLGVVFALAFVVYILATKPPQSVTHRITSRGVFFGESFYPWEELEGFWFKSLGGERVLVISVKRGFPSQLIMLLDGVGERRVQEVLEEHLEFVSAPREDWMERAARWFSSKVGLD